MGRLSLLTLVFAAASLVLFIGLVFLRVPFPSYPLLNWQDVFDLATPVILIPIYWLLMRRSASSPPTLGESLVFAALAAVWVEGQGIHLAANAIDNLIEALVRAGTLDLRPTDVYALTHALDEQLGHILWHLGLIGLGALLVVHEWRSAEPVGRTAWALVVPAGLAYGFTLFAVFLEGQTVILGLPFVGALTVAGALGLRHLGARPVGAFFVASGVVALVLLLGWGAYWGGFPQFSDVGLI